MRHKKSKNIDEIENKRKEDLDYILRFIYLLRNNAFDRRFLEELFTTSINIDMRKASREIIYFIVCNRHKWEKIQ